MKTILVILSVLIAVSNCVDIQSEKGLKNYRVELKYSNENQWEHVGNLQIDSQLQYKQAYISLKNNQEQIIDWKSQFQAPFAQLKFINEQDKNNVFLSHVDLTQQRKINLTTTKNGKNALVNQEILQLITNIDDKVVSINYTVKNVVNSQNTGIKAEFTPSLEAIEVNFIPGQGGVKGKGEKGPEGTETQQQTPGGIMGFVKQYFWYILIGIVIFVSISNVDPDKMTEQGQQQTQAQQKPRARARH